MIVGYDSNDEYMADDSDDYYNDDMDANYYELGFQMIKFHFFFVSNSGL